MTVLESVQIKTQALAQYCLEHGMRIATAESCTGGMVAAACTAMAGASQWFDRGYICYNNLAKHEQLEVPKLLLEHCGAVSPEVAQSLAAQTLLHSRADATLSITGFAGPASENDNHTVGTVFIGYASKHKPKGVAKHFLLPGERYAIRQAAMLESLCFLYQHVQNDFS